MQSVTSYIKASPWLYNLVLTSPLLFLGGVILWLLQRADTLRQGAGLRAPPLTLADELDGEEFLDDDQEDDIAQFYNDSGNDFEEDNDNDDEDLADDAGVHENGEPDGIVVGQPAQPRPRIVQTRQVGKKKARSLEQRDRRRAYHEFLAQQAADRRERDTAIEEEEEERTFTEKQRRAVAEIKIEQKRAAERALKQKEAEEHAESVIALKGVVERMKAGKMTLRDLGGKVNRNEVWIRRVLKEEKLTNIVGKDGHVVIITEDGCLVKMGKEQMDVLIEELERKGKMDWKEISLVLETLLSRRF